MFDATAANDPEALSADPAAERTARHAAILQELAELGMALVRRVVERAAAPEGEAGAVQGDPGLSFSRLSRAVRLTLALENRLFEAGKVAARPAPAEVGHRVRISRKDKAAHAVEDLIENTDEEYDAAEIESLLDDLNERLSEIEAADGFEGAPISAVVARICADLGLTPDWALWATRDWAKGEAREQVAGSPYMRPGRPMHAAGYTGAGAAPVRSPYLEAARATGPP